MLGSVVRLALGPGEKAPSFYLLGLSLIALLVADVGFGLTSLAGSYRVGSPVDAGYMLSYVLWGAAALHPSMRLMSTPAPVREATLTGARLAALAGASLIGPAVMAVQSLRGGEVAVSVIVAASAVVFLLVLARMWGLMHVLADTAAKRALATQREQTLRRAAAWLVGAGDRGAIHNAACDAIAAVAGGSAHSCVTVWAGSVEAATVVSSAGHRTHDPSGARLDLQALPPSLQSALGAGEPIELPRIDDALSAALLFDAGGGIGFVVPLLINGQLSGGFGVLTERPLSSEVKHSVLTLRDQVVLALESAALSEEPAPTPGRAALRCPGQAILGCPDDPGRRRRDHLPDAVRATRVRLPAGRADRHQPHRSGPPRRPRTALASVSTPLSAPEAPPFQRRTRHHDGSWVIARTGSTTFEMTRTSAASSSTAATSPSARRSRHSSRTRPSTTRSPACRTARCSSTGSQHALARAGAHGTAACAVLFLDLDDFKASTTASATPPATRCCVAVAERLRTTVPRRRHRRPARRRRVRRPARGRRRRRRGDRRVAERHRRGAARRRSRLGGSEVCASAEHRHRARPRDRRRRRRRAAARRRPRDVPGQGAAARAATTSSSPTCTRPRSSACELEADLRRAVERGELVAALPADRRPATGDDRRRRGARPLAAPEPRAASSPARVHPARRGDRPDRPDSAAGSSREACRQAARAGSGVPAADPPLTMQRQPVGAPAAATPTWSSDVAGRARRDGPRPASLVLEITESALIERRRRARSPAPGAHARSACGSPSTTSAPATRR